MVAIGRDKTGADPASGRFLERRLCGCESVIYLPSVSYQLSKLKEDELGRKEEGKRKDTASRKIDHQDAAGLLVEVGVFLVPFEAGALEEACYSLHRIS